MNPMPAKKRFGQHFLTDNNIIIQLINAIAPKAEDHIIEIGPGHGILTQAVLPHVKRLDAIEIDRDLVAELERVYHDKTNLTIHQQDVLKFDLKSVQENDERLRVIGNIPYNISTPLIFHVIKFATFIQDMHFMLQKEVAERLVASPGGKVYGRLSVMLQYHCEGLLLFPVGRDAFKPAPQVESAVVRLIPYRSLPYLAEDYSLFQRVVREAFSKRRKMIRNALKSILGDDEWQTLEIDPNLRAEEISVKKYVKISNLVYSNGAKQK